VEEMAKGLKEGKERGGSTDIVRYLLENVDD
jgi:hypothetical protein